jgi:gamma-glutamyltranspeptidase/glutathione hydrolase
VTEALAATSHPLATNAALAVLQRGGNAMDAAVAAAAVLAVAEPQATGIGGDCFVLYAPRGQGKVFAFNGSGRAPNAATCDWYREHGFATMPMTGVHSVSVPGAVDAWCRLIDDHGTRELAELLEPAIRYAEQGCVVPDRVVFDWRTMVELLAADENAKRIFLPAGRAPEPGEPHRQPELAGTLRTIAREGRKGFYEGRVAEDIVAYLRNLGGLHTLDDFAATRGDYVEPLRGTYRGTDILQMPPNNQGIVALMMLNILAGFDLGKLDPAGAERFHIEAEAGRLAYRDRDALVGDQDRVPAPIEKLLSQPYAEALRARIDLNRAADLPPPKLRTSDTVYLCVVDRDRNAVSFINSVYKPFGSGLVSPKTGVLLQNRGASFRLDPKHPNCVAPRKRPMHTIMPGMAMKGGRVLMPFGVMGGDYQPVGNVHVLTNMLDYAMDPQAAIDGPRAFHTGVAFEVERSVPAATVAGLERKGHTVRVTLRPHGGGQAIMIDWEKGTLTGGSDPRKDGCALGY